MLDDTKGVIQPSSVFDMGYSSKRDVYIREN